MIEDPCAWRGLKNYLRNVTNVAVLWLGAGVGVHKDRVFVERIWTRAAVAGKNSGDNEIGETLDPEFSSTGENVGPRKVKTDRCRGIPGTDLKMGCWPTPLFPIMIL